MQHMTIDQLIEHLTTARNNGLSGDTRVLIARDAWSHWRPIHAASIKVAKASKRDIEKKKEMVYSVANRGVEVLLIS